jgi:hypothetical protein
MANVALIQIKLAWVDDRSHALLQLGCYGCSSHLTQDHMWLRQVEGQGRATAQLVEGAGYGEQ